VTKLRESDLALVSDRLAQIPGVAVAEHGELLTTDKDLSSPALDDLPERWHDRITKTAGWSVYLFDDKGAPAERLTSTPPAATDPLRTTLDIRCNCSRSRPSHRKPCPTVRSAPSSSSTRTGEAEGHHKDGRRLRQPSSPISNPDEQQHTSPSRTSLRRPHRQRRTGHRHRRRCQNRCRPIHLYRIQRKCPWANRGQGTGRGRLPGVVGGFRVPAIRVQSRLTRVTAPAARASPNA
jgi:hypothetical protein